VNGARIVPVCALPRWALVNSRVVGAAAVACLLVTAATAGAQTRFEAITQSAIEGVSGLRIITVRDRTLNNCYLLFVSDPPVPQTDARPPAPELEQVRAERDRRLADLVHAYEQDRSAIPGTIIPNPLKYELQGSATQIDFALVVLEQLFARLEEELDRLAEATRMAMTAMPISCAPPAGRTSP